ncbi:MAG: hypothetical protein KA214_01515 [Neisseriaceae bacterium]|nr:hypothetical protein [Neisseriaceae bacterium]
MRTDAAVFEAAFLVNVRQLGAYLYASDAAQEAWYQSCVAVWRGQQQADDVSPIGQPQEDLVGGLLAQTHESVGGPDCFWHYIDWKDTETLVAFFERCAAQVLPDGLRWSVEAPTEVLDGEALFLEANQQLQGTTHQFYNMDCGGDAYLPVFVQDCAGLEALAQRLNLRLEAFAALPLETTAVSVAPSKGRTFFSIVYLLAVVWVVYQGLHWVISHVWHWFD